MILPPAPHLNGVELPNVPGPAEFDGIRSVHGRQRMDRREEDAHAGNEEKPEPEGISAERRLARRRGDSVLGRHACVGPEAGGGGERHVALPAERGDLHPAWVSTTTLTAPLFRQRPSATGAMAAPRRPNQKVRTAYDMLGIEPDADYHAIKSAYRSLAKRYHPDVFTHAGLPEAHPWIDIRSSYDLLCNASKRATYDDIVVQGGSLRLAKPEHFDRWWHSHIRVDYDSGVVYKGDVVFHQMGDSATRVLRHRHAIAWAMVGGVFAVQTVALARRLGTPARPCNRPGFQDRAAVLGEAVGTAGALAGALTAASRAIRPGRVAVATLASALAGRAVFGHVYSSVPESAQSLPSTSAVLGVMSCHASALRPYVGTACGMAIALRSAPALGRAHVRVGCGGVVGGICGLLGNAVLSRLPPTDLGHE